MPRKVIVPILLLVAVIGGAIWYVRHDSGHPFYTGFVEGEERVIRSEVNGRVLDVRFPEGATVPPNSILVVLSGSSIEARINSMQQEIAVLDAELRTQQERIALVESTWKRDVSVRSADLRQAEAAANLAQRTLKREQDLVKTGASTAQSLDDNRSRRDQAGSALEHARQMLGRTEAEERQIALAQNELHTLQQRRALATAQLEELQVAQSKHTIRSPNTTTNVQTQFIWPGELAQPGTAVLALLDPTDKYVQFYIPVTQLGGLHVGQRVAIELDSAPDRRIPGEVSFIADKANFTPEKIETRSDRVGQVYRVKVRVLEGVERLQPGTEGNVYPQDDGGKVAVTSVVELRGLRKRFGAREALRGVDLTLPGREIVGIVGPDGAGKTTLIRALAGLLEIDAEVARVLDYDLRSDDITPLKAAVGYVPQSFGLHRELTVMENLRFTARLHRLPLERFEARAREVLDRTRMTPFMNRTAGALSGGMKQKLAVANALLLQPGLLLLDEPTAGVDVLARTEIWSMLEAAREHALVVLSTSYLEEADGCDRLVYLDNGRVVATGTPASLRASVPLELYRAWSSDPRAVAKAARQLAYVEGARQTGTFTRIEVPKDRTPGFAKVRADLLALSGVDVRLVEILPLDMESTLLHLARGVAVA